MPHRRLVFILSVAAAAISAPVFAEEPQPTPIVPQAVPAQHASAYFTVGLGVPGETDLYRARTPALVCTVGGSFPVKRKVYIDIAMGFSIGDYEGNTLESAWSGEPLLETFSLTASVRGGHAGQKVAVYGSLGGGLAFVRLGAPGGYGYYPEPVGSTMAPVLTVAGSLEGPARNPSRFVAELRYSWIEANLGGAGSLNAGGPMLLMGWRYGF